MGRGVGKGQGKRVRWRERGRDGLKADEGDEDRG